MAAFNVFVEAAADPSPEGTERLAAAIAQHYGLPVGELKTRLAKGRFRVKGNCDRATADAYVRDLTKLGARCAVEDAEAPAARASTPSLPPRTTQPPARPSGNFQSGLSAAFSGDVPAASLGALADDAGMLKLSSVDGADEPAPQPTAAFSPPPEVVATPRTATKPKVAEAPVDMFAPPDAAEEAAFKVELADDEVERSAKKRSSIPPAEVPIAQPVTAPARISRPSIQPPPAVASQPRGLADPKQRFALGVLIAIVVGFVPAHAIASLREHSAYAEIDQLVDKTQREADTDDAYDALDAFRARELARKYDARHSAAILAFLIWAAAGAGIGYVWFRKIRWPA